MKTELFQTIAGFIALLKKNSARSSAPEYYRWKVHDNPFQRGYIYIEYDNAKIKGITTLAPKRIASFGQSYLAAEIGDSYTHYDYRHQGVFTRSLINCTKHAISSGIQIIYGLTNERSFPGEKKVGFKICTNAHIKYLQKIINVLPIELAFKRKIRHPTLAKVLSRLYHSIISFRWLFYRRRIKYPIETIEESFQQRDGFWGSNRGDYVFFTYRDSTFLNWRYINNPDGYTILTAGCKGHNLGYIVLKIWTRGDLVYGTVCDFMVCEDRMDIFHNLMTAAEIKFKSEGVHIVELCCAKRTAYFKVLSRIGYRTVKDIPIIVFHETELGRRIIESDGKWFFTYADTDHN